MTDERPRSRFSDHMFQFIAFEPKDGAKDQDSGQTAPSRAQVMKSKREQRDH